MPDVSENQINYDFQSDNNGNWQFEFSDKLAPGPHTVIVEDTEGNQDQVMMYVVKEPVPTTVNQPKIEILDRVTTLMPPFFLYAAAVLLISIVLLMINHIRLARKADKGELNGLERHYTRGAAIFCLIILVVVCITGVWLNRKTNFISDLIQRHVTPVEAVRFSGKIMDPVTLQGVGGVDVTSGDTSIRTSGSGQFIFDNVSPSTGVRINYADLLRAITFLPGKYSAEQNVNLYFNVNLFNNLIRVIDLESRGKFGDIYPYLAPEIRQKITREQFADGATTYFGPQNISEQDIKVAGTKIFDNWVSPKYDIRFAKVLEIELSVNGHNELYHIAWSGDGWQLIK